jgi:hypothetical protein
MSARGVGNQKFVKHSSAVRQDIFVRQAYLSKHRKAALTTTADGVRYRGGDRYSGRIVEVASCLSQLLKTR